MGTVDSYRTLAGGLHPCVSFPPCVRPWRQLAHGWSRLWGEGLEGRG